MSNEKIIKKCRKEHTCNCCDKIINIGDSYIRGRGKCPKYGEDLDTQIGIEYYEYCLCLECAGIFNDLKEEVKLCS